MKYLKNASYWNRLISPISPNHQLKSAEYYIFIHYNGPIVLSSVIQLYVHADDTVLFSFLHLQCPGAEILQPPHPYQLESGPVFLQGLSCNGNESSLFDCET